jgi:hypothetical protein
MNSLRSLGGRDCGFESRLGHECLMCVPIFLCLLFCVWNWSPVRGTLQPVNDQETEQSALCSNMGASSQGGKRKKKIINITSLYLYCDDIFFGNLYIKSKWRTFIFYCRKRKGQTAGRPQSSEPRRAISSACRQPLERQTTFYLISSLHSPY